MTTDATPAARERALALLRRHGWNATSFQILEPGFSYWFDGDDACVGYVDTGGPGSPRGRRWRRRAHRRRRARFVAAARRARRRVLLLRHRGALRGAPPAGRRCASASSRSGTRREWADDRRRQRSLREQLRRARAKGVDGPRELDGAELAAGARRRARGRRADRALARVAADGADGLPRPGRSVHVPRGAPLLRRRARRRGSSGSSAWFRSTRASGWFFEDFIRDPSAPNGTVELLVDAGMRAAAAARTALVTLGLAPLAGEVGPWLRVGAPARRALYDFDGLRAFKAKLRPALGPDLSRLTRAGSERASRSRRADRVRARRPAALRAARRCCAGRRSSCACSRAARAVDDAARAAPERPWFPSPAVQWGWVAFDVVLVVALSRWRAAGGGASTRCWRRW